MKELIVSYHGLGDNILLTPVLRKYKEEHSGVSIGLAHLRRLPVNDLLEKCPYIDEFFTVSDVWNDFPDFETGFNAVVEEAKVIAQDNEYNTMRVVTTAIETGHVHKIHRAARELNVVIEDYTTEIFPRVTNEILDQADEFLSKVDGPYVFIHLKTGNPPKDIGKNAVAQFLENISPTQIIEYGSRIIPSNYLPLGNIPLEMEILRRCALVTCADSFIMHAACALGIPTQVIFTMTPPEWVIPLHDNANLTIYRKV